MILLSVMHYLCGILVSVCASRLAAGRFSGDHGQPRCRCVTRNNGVFRCHAAERSWAHCRVSEMTSSSSLGSTRIILQFDFDRDINGAARDVQAAINAAQSLLPSGMPSRPTYRKRTRRMRQ